MASLLRSVSTLVPSATSMSWPLTVIRTNKRPPPGGCGLDGAEPAHRVPFAGITQIRFEGSRAAPGSQESSPHGERPEYTPGPGLDGKWPLAVVGERGVVDTLGRSGSSTGGHST